MNWKRMMMTAMMCVGITASVSATGHGMQEVSPDEWAYKALVTLVKHGAITDTKGLTLGSRSYTRYELTPIIAEAVAKREVMNDSDKQLAIRLYKEYRDDLMDYEAEQERRANRRVLSDEEIARRMDDFRVDTGRVKVGGEVRIRYTNGAGRHSKNDARALVEFSIGSGAGAPAELQPVNDGVTAVPDEEKRPADAASPTGAVTDRAEATAMPAGETAAASHDGNSPAAVPDTNADSAKVMPSEKTATQP